MALASLFFAASSVTVAAAAPEPAPRIEGLADGRYTLQRITPRITSGAATQTLELDGRSVTLELERVSLRAPGFRLLTPGADGSLQVVPAPAPETYRGRIRELPGSTAGGAIRDGRVTAAIALPDGRTYFVQPVSELGAGGDPQLHAVYLDEAATASGTCATTEHSVTIEGGGSNSTLGTSLQIADLAFDSDYEMYMLNGSSVPATVSDLEAVLSAVNVVYERDCGIRHRLVQLIVRSSEPDPYTSTDPGDLLDELEDYWNTTQTGVARDVVHLMTGKNIDDSVIGIAAVGVICNRSRAYGLSQSRFTSNMARRVALTAHELGHNWNADHCDGADPCNIMCSSLGGCDGIGLPNFEPEGATTIMNFAATRTCLETPMLAVGPAAGAASIRLAASPTPFEERTEFSYHLSRGGHVRLAIYDVTGQRVAVLVDGARDAGSYTQTWTGADRTGRRLPPGVYHARIEVGGESRSVKVIRVK